MPRPDYRIAGAPKDPRSRGMETPRGVREVCLSTREPHTEGGHQLMSTITTARDADRRRTRRGRGLLVPRRPHDDQGVVGDHRRAALRSPRTWLRRAAGSPLHVHTNEDEWFYVIEGELTFWVDGQVSVAPAGSFVYGPQRHPAHVRRQLGDGALPARRRARRVRGLHPRRSGPRPAPGDPPAGDRAAGRRGRLRRRRRHSASRSSDRPASPRDGTGERRLSTSAARRLGATEPACSPGRAELLLLERRTRSDGSYRWASGASPLRKLTSTLLTSPAPNSA